MIEFRRGDRLLATLPELSGVGLRENGFRVAPPETVAATRSVIARQVAAHPSVVNTDRTFASTLAKRLLARRGEFMQWRKISTMLERITRFAVNL